MSISQSSYSKKFYIYQPRGSANGLGYGPNRMWSPPLSSSNTIITSYLRHFLSVFMGPAMAMHSLQMWLYSSIAAPWDGLDFVWYNNSEAVGNQLYPRGIHLFYDMYSFGGLMKWGWEWIYFAACQSIAIFTLLIPINLWFDWLSKDTTQWDMVVLLFYSIGGFPFAMTYCTFKFCEIENGW